MRIRILNQKFSIAEIWKLRGSIFGVVRSPKKWINFILIMLLQKLGKKKVFGKPFTLMIEASSKCDMACPMCPVILDHSRRKKGDMDFGTFKNVIKQVGDSVIFLSLWNFGEPLLNKDIFKMVKLAKTKRIICSINTNALSLNKDKINELVSSDLDYLIVSFDGATKETFEKFRGKGNFEPVLNNLKNLIAEKKKRRKTVPFINLQFIVMKENEHEIGLIKKLSEDIGADKLALKKFTYVGNNTDEFLPQKEEYKLGKYKGNNMMEFCSRPWQSAVVSWDGAVIPCCGDLQFQHIFGDIAGNERFSDIWNNEKYINFRRAILKDINSVKICQTCPSTDFTTDMFIE